MVTENHSERGTEAPPPVTPTPVTPTNVTKALAYRVEWALAYSSLLRANDRLRTEWADLESAYRKGGVGSHEFAAALPRWHKAYVAWCNAWSAAHQATPHRPAHDGSRSVHRVGS
jgi:hypothetical protein